jgi:prolyl-tRNA synthetase
LTEANFTGVPTNQDNRPSAPFDQMHISAHRGLAMASRTRPPLLSKMWMPTGGIAAGHGEDGHAKLLRAGYLRQSNPGIFHFLPLGVRVLDKLRQVLVDEMGRLGASEVSLSSLTSEQLWRKSGRLSNDAQLFRFADRRGTPYMLGPTHEEEITTLVSRIVRSHNDLPLRLYQISL